MKRFTLLILMCVGLCVHVFGQYDGNVSRLSEQDSLALKSLKTSYATLINPKPDSAYLYLKKFQTLVHSLNYDIGRVEASYLYASYFRRMQNTDSAIYHFKKSVELADKMDFDKGRSMAYNGLCHVYSKVGEMELASSACLSCVEYAKKSKQPEFEAAGYLALGQIHMRQNDLKKALLYNLKVDSVHQATPIREVIVAGAYQNIGDVYMGLKEFDKAESYFLKSIDLYNSMPQDMTFYLNHSNWYLGQLHYAKGEYQKSLGYLEDCHVYFGKIKDNHTLAEISKTLGLIYIKNGQQTKGGELLQQAYDLQKEFENRNETASIGLELGQVYTDQGEINKAIEILNNSLRDVERLHNSNLSQEINLQLGQAYSKKGDFAAAYKYHQIGSVIKDSLNLIQSADQIRELEALYQTEKNERELNALRSQKELNEEQSKNQRNILLGGIGITSLASLFFFFLYRNRQKTTRKLKEIDQAKSTFFTNISHEFRTPLTLIKGPIQEQLKREDLPNETRRKFEMMDRNSNRLLNLVDQTLDISKIESGGLILRISAGNITSFIGTLADAYGYLASEKNIDYSINIQNSSNLTWYDADAVEKMVTNLLGNAFKYTPQGSRIQVEASVDTDRLNFVVKNEGPGIGKESIKRIFDRFYQGNTVSDGVGVGLSLVKDLVSLHKGEIKVASEPNSWTTFTIEFPVAKNAFQAAEIVSHTKVASVVATSEGNSDVAKEENMDSTGKPIMLIVEDNKDVREFVKDLFATDYSLLEAENGQKGLELALEHVPDIILSDVMMPIMDGVELCQSLKKNSCTSHIPLILLTAKAGDENELEGIKSGADDYITKPFNVDLIKTKIDNLLQSRKLLRDRYSNELFVQPKDIAVNSADEELLVKIQEILNEKISDGKFSVEEFSSMVGMSRMQLHRKLKSLTGLSSSEFIRSQRIIMASQLLQKTDKNVSEVGYSVGFNDPAYFSKCFKEVYKCTPSEYASKN